METLKVLNLIIFFLYFVLEINSDVVSNEDDTPEDAKLNVHQLLTKYGYPSEVHHVVTVDGYILEMHRIPYGRALNAGPKANKPIVFIQHGLLASSSCFIIAGPKKALGYALADLGYDVWMGNARGTRYSRNHTSLNTNEREFWDFSWHEIGVTDLPAMIDYVLKKTGQESLYYIGHSQGGTVFYVMTSEVPEYNKKIRVSILLAPAGYMSHMKSKLFRLIAGLDATGEVLLQVIGDFEFMPDLNLISKLLNNACVSGAQLEVVCSNIIFLLFGYNEEQLEVDLIPVIIGHMPAGASTKQGMHYGHEIESGNFEQYDYGPIGNLNKYNSVKPPRYNLSQITTPVVIFYGENDYFVGEEDIERIYKVLRNAAGKYFINGFNHIDFIFAKDINSLLHDDIIKLMKKY